MTATGLREDCQDCFPQGGQPAATVERGGREPWGKYIPPGTLKPACLTTGCERSPCDGLTAGSATGGKLGVPLARHSAFYR